ncbi:ferritin-like domain-containing protein [Basfia succiniciproducens]|uniref:Bacterioferritin n=1 Tax=Basfia succiniciproducens TaxID=653940 RepID=A0A1G5E999_9PAST|nr:ferritin-like domain-containing protein [Basfia succiniciproducens]QIM69284.1 Bfr protein [Basfia succiniciproducens]SCY23290.1 bacterioferritin [Basfia succiniciproducens]SEQ59371.1 bacterioferritin [Basfia succiniciproducens]
MATEKQIEILKGMAKAWFGNSQQHSIHAEIIRQKGFSKLADKIQAEAEGEWKEAQRVNARLLELGVTPTLAIDTYPIITDIREQLEYDYNEGLKGMAELNAMIAEFSDDYITRRMIEEFIVDEQEHTNWLAEHIGLIEEIGYQNYLIQQL